ncbi:MAG: EamA family transporter [Candidatus Sumerlaeota bacterium]|nr:EamA family transporter [Candidatus Sumerlaeota bacterium]
MAGAVSAVVGIVLYSTYTLIAALGVKKHALGPDAVGMYCHTLAICIVCMVVFARGHWNLVSVALKRHLALFMAISILAAAVAWTSIHGLKLSSLSSLAILVYTDVIFTLLLGWLFFHERINWTGLIAIGLIFSGAAIRIAGNRPEGDAAPPRAAVSRAAENPASDGPAPVAFSHDTSRLSPRAQRLLGDFLFVAYGFCLALNAFLIKRLLRHVTWDVVLLGNYAGRLGTFALCAIATGQAAAGWASVSHHAALAALLAAGGLFAPAGMLFYYRALSLIPVWMVKVFQMTGTALVLVYDYWFFAQTPTGYTMLGTALVSSGALCVFLYDPLFRRADKRDASEGA